MPNLIPTHKTELERILGLVVWDGQTFADRETAGAEHIHTTMPGEVSNFPCIIISHQTTRIDYLDTAQDIDTNSYRIRMIFKLADNNDIAETALEELNYLIIDKLREYKAGDNSTWEGLTYSGGTEITKDQDGYLIKDLTVSVTNTVLRTNNYL